MAGGAGFRESIYTGAIGRAQEIASPGDRVCQHQHRARLAAMVPGIGEINRSKDVNFYEDSRRRPWPSRRATRHQIGNHCVRAGFGWTNGIRSRWAKSRRRRIYRVGAGLPTISTMMRPPQAENESEQRPENRMQGRASIADHRGQRRQRSIHGEGKSQAAWRRFVPAPSARSPKRKR